MRKPLAIIGMSPGNSYFKDYEVRFLLQEAVARFGRCAIMVADVPAISTYLALGYSPTKARNKAIPKGNNLKNRTRRLAEELGFTPEQVRIVDWQEEVEDNAEYHSHYKSVQEKYDTLPAFNEAVRRTTLEVLDNQGGAPVDQTTAEGATHYLLSEIAFMEFAPEFFSESRVCYLYHREWKVYEDYIDGQFDGFPKDQLDFLLLEAPSETYVQFHKGTKPEASAMLHDTYSRVMQSGVLRAAYSQYPPAIVKHGDLFSGVFFDIITLFAEKHGLEIKWVEETGYGVVIEGLAAGRFDIFCSATWPTPERQRQAALSYPVYYSDVGIWVRADSAFVGQDWIELNNGGRIAITENDVSHAIALTDFSRAKWVRVPQLAQVKGLIEAVADGRADATMVERATVDVFGRELSAPLVNIAADKPIRRYANSFLIGKNQNDFLDLIDSHILGLLRRGRIRPLLERYLGNLEGIYLPKV